MVEIININEIKKNLANKDESKKRLLKIMEIFFNSVKDLINKDDYDFDKNKINKKILAMKNENIKRKKIFFGEMLNFLNKLKKNFEVINDKEFTTKLEDINNLYKNTINTKYVIIIQDNNNSNNNSNNKKNKTEDKTKIINEEKMDIDDNKEKNDKNIDDNEEEKEEKIDEENDNKINKEIKEENENEINEEGLELEEEPDIKKEKAKEKKVIKDKQKKDKKDKKDKNKNKENELIEMKNKKTKRNESKNKEEKQKDKNKNKKKKK
jgi:hypothetical protein